MSYLEIPLHRSSLPYAELYFNQVSMMQRELEERLEGKLMFWGKVEGNENDYLVCYALATPKLEEGDFPLKKVHFKTDVNPLVRLRF